MNSRKQSSDKAIISAGGSMVSLLRVSTEPSDVFTYPSECLQLVSNNYKGGASKAGEDRA